MAVIILKMSRVMRKPAFCIYMQIYLVVFTIPLHPKSEISSLSTNPLWFVSDLVGNPKDRFSCDAAQIADSVKPDQTAPRELSDPPKEQSNRFQNCSPNLSVQHFRNNTIVLNNRSDCLTYYVNNIAYLLKF